MEGGSKPLPASCVRKDLETRGLTIMQDGKRCEVPDHLCDSWSNQSAHPGFARGHNSVLLLPATQC